MLAREQAQERGFAGAVAADQGDALAGFDGEIDAVEQQGTADAEVDVIQGQDRHPRSLPAGSGGGTLAAHPPIPEYTMAKGMDQKKQEKKKPEKTLKEKRAEKKDKKNAR